MSDEQKPRVEDESSTREFWIGINKASGTVSPDGSLVPDIEQIHVIEYSAYEAMCKERDEAIANYERKSNNGEAIKQELLKLRAELEALQLKIKEHDKEYDRTCVVLEDE